MPPILFRLGRLTSGRLGNPPLLARLPAPPDAAFDPAVGFPWNVDDSQPQAVIGWDPTEQAWAVQSPPFVNSDSAFTVVPLAFDATEQSWSVQPVAPPPSPILGWTTEESRQSAPGTDPTEQAWPVQVITAAAAFDPANGFPWNDAGPTVLSSVWFDATEQSFTIVPSALDPTTLAGLWTYADPTQDRSLQPVWYDPSDLGSSWSATLPLVASITGGTPPGAFASRPGLAATAVAPAVEGRASSPVSGGSAETPSIGGNVQAPTPGGSASSPKPSR